MCESVMQKKMRGATCHAVTSCKKSAGTTIPCRALPLLIMVCSVQPAVGRCVGGHALCCTKSQRAGWVLRLRAWPPGCTTAALEHTAIPRHHKMTHLEASVATPLPLRALRARAARRACHASRSSIAARSSTRASSFSTTPAAEERAAGLTAQQAANRSHSGAGHSAERQRGNGR